MNWVGGVTVPEAALQMLGQGGIPNIGLVQGGAITAVKLEHVWVEAWVDFEPSRGAVHREGDTWVPLDAAFKQYQYTAGMDLQGQISFDAQAFVNQVTASAQVNGVEGWVDGLDHSVIQNILTTYQVQIDTYVTTQKPNATVGDVLGTKTIVPARRPVLAMGLPYMVVVRGNVWTQIPDTLRHQFRFHLYATALDQILDAPILSLTQSLPTLAGKKLTFVLCTSESGRCGSSDELSAATPYQWGPTGPPHVSNLAAWVSHPTGRRTPGRGPGCRQRRTVHHGAGVGEYTGIV
jgi:hypothetical protein